MATHVSARVAWHADGWNGRICRDPRPTRTAVLPGAAHRQSAHWEKKRAWYERFFPGQLVTTEESGELSKQADEVIRTYFQ